MNKNLKNNDSFFVYGIQPVIELLKSNHSVENVIIAKETDAKVKNRIINLAKNRNLSVESISKQYVQRYTGPVLHQGVVAKLNAYQYINEKFLFTELLKSENVLILILDEIQDPHNVGAIIRTAEIAGATCIILPEKGSAPINSTVAKTSTGAVFHIPIHQTNDLYLLIEELKSNKIQIIAAEEGQQNNLFKSDIPSKIALIIGSEGKGVRKNLKKLADKNISIPQFGKVNSLNASVSAAVILYEIVRQRNFKD